MRRNNLLFAGMLSVLLATSACGAVAGTSNSPVQSAGSTRAGVEASSGAGYNDTSAEVGASQVVATAKVKAAEAATDKKAAAGKATAETSAAVLPASSSERIVKTTYTTAYTWYDNTPAGSATISHPVLHKTAGGAGTYSDPITIAVGHSLATGKDVLDFPAGTRIYLPDVRRYFIVEDTCGDGKKPEGGPCHQGVNADGTNSTIWIDMWIGGQSMNAAGADKCASKVTDVHTAVFNPASNYAVAPGAGVIHDGKCDAGYGNALMKK